MFTELESQLKQQQQPDLKREVITLDGESSPKVRELEKIIRLLKQEKEEAQKASKQKIPAVYVCVDDQKWCDIPESVISGKHYSYGHFPKIIQKCVKSVKNAKCRNIKSGFYCCVFCFYLACKFFTKIM